MERFKITHLVLFLGVLILFALPFFWFPSGTYYLGGDDTRLYDVFPEKWLKHTSFYSWFGTTALGYYAPQQSYIGYNLLVSAGKLVAGDNIQKIMIGLDLALGFLAVYLLINELIRSQNYITTLSGIIAGIAYIFFPLTIYLQWNNYLKSVHGIGFYSFIFTLLFLYLNKGKYLYLFLGAFFFLPASMSILSVAISAPFFFSALLFLSFYILISKKKLSLYFSRALKWLLLTISLNAFWILPFLDSLRGSYSKSAFLLGEQAKTGAERLLDYYVGKMSLLDTIVGQVSSGLIGEGSEYILFHKYYFLNLVIGLFFFFLIFLSLIKAKRKGTEMKKLYKVYILSISIYLLLLFFQTVNIGSLGPELFNFFINYIPGFVIMRNFYMRTPIVLGYFFGICLGLSFYIISKTFLKTKRREIFFFSLIIPMLVFRGLPLIKGSVFHVPIKQGLPKRYVQIPTDYINLLGYFENLKDNARIMTVPLTFGSWEMFGDDNSNMFIGTSPLRLIGGREGFVGRLSFNSPYLQNLENYTNNNIIGENYGNLQKLFGFLGIKYVVVNESLYQNKAGFEPARDFYVWPKNSFRNIKQVSRFIENLNLVLVKDFEGIKIYETPAENLFPKIYSPKELFKVARLENVTTVLASLKTKNTAVVDPEILLTHFPEDSQLTPPQKIIFSNVNPVKYKVKIQGADTPFVLILMENFHDGWKVYVKEGTNFKDNIVSEYSEGVFEAERNKSFYDGKFYETFFKTPLSEKNHFLVNGYANSWIIDPNEVCNNSEIATSPTTPRNDKAVCIKNPDGTYDMELVVEFWPQRLFYLGAAISLSTLIGCLIYLGYDWRKNRSLAAKKTLLKPLV